MWIVVVRDRNNGTRKRFYQTDDFYDAQCWAREHTDFWYETYTLYKAIPVKFSE